MAGGKKEGETIELEAHERKERSDEEWQNAPP